MEAIRRTNGSQRGLDDAAAVLRVLPFAVLALDGAGRVRQANRAAERLLGVPSATLRGRALLVLVEVDHRPAVRSALARAQAGFPVRSLECCFTLDGGPARWADAEVVPAEGGVIVIARDMGERRALRNDVASQHDTLQEALTSLLDSLPVGVVIADGHGAPRLVNRAARDLLGMHALTPIALWGDTGIVQHPDGTPADPAALPALRTLADGRSRRNVELNIVRPSGEAAPVLLGTDAVRNARGEIVEVCCTFTLIHERRHIQRQLLQAQKMDALGALAGGIAHDFNNILCAITGYSELALAQARMDEHGRRLVGEIHKAGERAAALTRQLLAFARDDRRWHAPWISPNSCATWRGCCVA